MSFEDSEIILNKEKMDNSIINRKFLKVYYQQGPYLHISDQNVEFTLWRN